MKRRFLQFLAFCYLLGFFLHVADLFDLRLKFSEMDIRFKTWIVGLTIFDALTAYGLFRGKKWGEWLFLFVAGAQLLAYLGFPNYFGLQIPLIAFHLACIAVYLVMQFRLGGSK